MAKIFKIFGYIIDADDEITQNDIELLFDHDKYINISRLECKQSKEFEWHDDIDINFTDAKQEDFEKYFDEELIIKSPSNLDKNQYNELVNALKDMSNDGVAMPVNVEIESRDQSTAKILQNEIKGKTIKNIKFDEDCELTIIFDDGTECVIVSTMYEGININIHNDKIKRI